MATPSRVGVTAASCRRSASALRERLVGGASTRGNGAGTPGLGRLLSGGKSSERASQRTAEAFENGEIPEPPSTMTTMASMGFGAIGAVGIAAVGVYGAFNMALWAARESGRSFVERQEAAAAAGRGVAADPSQASSHKEELEEELAALRRLKRNPELDKRKAAIKKQLRQMD